MTDKVTADNVYLKLLTKSSIIEILKKHKIDVVLPTMGGTYWPRESATDCKASLAQDG